MNLECLTKEMSILGYKQVPEYENSFYKWIEPPTTRVSIIFNYNKNAAYGYLAYKDLICDKEDLEKIKKAYLIMKQDLESVKQVANVTIEKI